MAQKRIPFMQIRGGSSKGVFFNRADLPERVEERNEIILTAMEGLELGDSRQIDGLGGGDPLSAKVALVSPSKRDDADLDYLFLQVVIGEGRLSAKQGCGNILAGVVHFAIESGMLKAAYPTTKAVIRMVNNGGLCKVSVQTLDSQIAVGSSARVDGVPGTGAPVFCNYFETAGVNCGSLLPTGNLLDEVDGARVTCVDNGMPLVALRATDFGITGYENREDLDSNKDLKTRLESIRLQMGPKMNLGEVTTDTLPKMCLLSPPRSGGQANTRTFIPHQCHTAIGVMGAFSAAAVCLLQGSIAEGIAEAPDDPAAISLEHPSGQLTVSLKISRRDSELEIHESGAIRTARIISKGEVFVP
ncbi:MAG: hypothetical protein MK240_07520 [Opitutales bacterium]|nr:hypothetical protein [Opitutales bacterium]